MTKGRCQCGQAGWRLSTRPDAALACSCTLCRQYGTLWAYGFTATDIEFSGSTIAYKRADKPDPSLAILFCPTCAGVVGWQGLKSNPNGLYRAAVNLRLAEPDAVGDLPIIHSDGLHSFDDLPSDGRRVRDLWF